MISLILENHNISFFYNQNIDITESEIGAWLHENNIDYGIIDYVMNVSIDTSDTYIFVKSMSFRNREDVTGFILRWSGTIRSPISIY